LCIRSSRHDISVFMRHESPQALYHQGLTVECLTLGAVDQEAEMAGAGSSE
jgi:hypothetical protein